MSPVSPSSTEPLEGTASFRPYTRHLLELAETSIDHGLERGSSRQPDPQSHPVALRVWRASFVTLQLNGSLRGCIGSLEARRPLVTDVADNAFGAAFRDPRFPALTPQERGSLALKIEILTPPEPLEFQTEEELLAQLEPGRDGLLLEAGRHRGTFLPTVWESLPETEAFWNQLKRKAGLPAHYFSENMAVYRYRTEVLP